jgi:orotidine-5'-phosphate decarboxylase
MSFGQRLEAAIETHGSVCVGIDPHTELLRAWGLPVSIDGLRTFTDTCVSAFAGNIGVVKPQSAFFEQWGAEGIAVLEAAIRALRAAGTLVLLDVKRGDIGSTMEAYAHAYLDQQAPLAVDAITVSPYLGVGSLEPAFTVAAAQDGGVFVLALTSNPEGPQFQHATTTAGRTVGQTVVDDIAVRNAGAEPMGSFGLVVGATIGRTQTDFSALNGPILSPGVGAQGGDAESVKQVFGDALRNVLPAVSREVLRNGPTVDALRDALERQRDAFSFLRK